MTIRTTATATAFLAVLTTGAFAQDTSLPAVAEPLTITGPEPDPIDEGEPLTAARKSKIACYFEISPTRLRWEWARTSGKKKYWANGTWFRTPLTGVEVFRASSKLSDITTACNNAKKQKKIDGKLVARLAAGAYNYPLIADKAHVDPEF